MAGQKTTIQPWADRHHFIAFADATPDYEIRLGDSPPPSATHECLLGQITQANTIVRPRLVCRDVDGREFVVALYAGGDDDAGMARLLKGFRVGHTVAIYYPVGHQFLDASRGVRVEDTDKILIMPLSLDNALAMNEQAVEFVNRDATPRKCHGCGEAKQELDKCARCALFHYCNRECQTKGWDSHKKYCKALKDENIKKMLLFDHDNLNGSQISFH
ncbi:putative set domain protein [Rosellinia necatrix]|uniref:Putative set domain protein n=1 Tax=Rosellinia necatrix TaxID=77044 RepID=A0A1W2TJY2_ROSNE|nr:putative set domain protein [Rosellinia necatrix]